MSPLIFNLDTRCRRVVSVKPRHLHRRKECRFPLTVEGWGGHPSRYGRFGEETNLLPLRGFESRNQVAVPITFSRQLCN